jgi:hypothetical protein
VGVTCYARGPGRRCEQEEAGAASSCFSQRHSKGLDRKMVKWLVWVRLLEEAGAASTSLQVPPEPGPMPPPSPGGQSGGIASESPSVSPMTHHPSLDPSHHPSRRHPGLLQDPPPPTIDCRPGSARVRPTVRRATGTPRCGAALRAGRAVTRW